MSKIFVLAFYLFTATYQTQKVVNAAPYNSEDQNAIIVIPFKASEEQITKIESFKIDGETAVKQLTSRVSAAKIIRTLSNVPEFSVLVEGLDAITLGDVYKAAFPSGILQSINEKYIRSPKLTDNKAVITKPDDTTGVKIPSDDIKVDKVTASEAEIVYDEVNEDDPQKNDEELKEEPITDDYVYDQPAEDRFMVDREDKFVVDREQITTLNDKVENDAGRGSKNINLENTLNLELKNKELSKYGAKFRNWITDFLAG